MTQKNGIVERIAADWLKRLGIGPRVRRPTDDDLRRAIVSPYYSTDLAADTMLGAGGGQTGNYPTIQPPIVPGPSKATVKLWPNNPVIVGLSPIILLLDNPDRKEFRITNVSTATIFIGLGSSPTTTQYDQPLPACSAANDGTGGVYIDDLYTGVVWAVSNSSSGAIALIEK